MIDVAHRVFVNYEIYYFADDALRQRFLAEPVDRYAIPVYAMKEM